MVQKPLALCFWLLCLSAFGQTGPALVTAKDCDIAQTHLSEAFVSSLVAKVPDIDMAEAQVKSQKLAERNVDAVPRLASLSNLIGYRDDSKIGD